VSRIIIPSIQLGEIRTTTFDFKSQMAVGETISTQVCTAAVFSGNDGAPSAVVSGAATASGSVVSQKLLGNVEGTVYNVQCTITTSTGQTLKMGGYLSCNPVPV